MDVAQFTTLEGILIERQTTPLALEGALDSVYQHIDTAKGGLLVSNYEYPDRYSRWDIGFVHPALELRSRQRHFEINALNPNGECLLSVIQPVLENHEHLEELNCNKQQIKGLVKPMPAFFTEEERSKQPTVFSVIRSLSQLFQTKDPYLGLYGGFGYDLVFQFENIQQKHTRPEDQTDCHLFLPTELIMVDRQKEKAFQVSYRIQTPAGTTSSEQNQGATTKLTQGKPDGIIHCDHEPGSFEEKVETIRKRCQQGDHFEVVLSQSFHTSVDEAPSSLFRRICSLNPSPYSFLINMGNEAIVGASPEMYVRVKDGRFETCPISGTIAVGDDPMETAENIKTLLSSEKEESELAMCTDVDRNDMSRVCEPGSVRLLGRRLIEQYSRLIHTVDHVEGCLAKGYDALDALLCHMWACTVTGSPKPIAMQTIEDLENSPRGWYSGCVGFVAFNGNLNTGMTLRTVHLKDGNATIRAGATLLYESDAKAEENETRVKASAFLDAVMGVTKTKPHFEIKGDVGARKKILFVDHHDSFVHTLANYVRQTGAEVTTVRPGFPMQLFEDLKPDLLFISPGPLTPKDHGVAELVGEAVARGLPIFGVCLGLQGIAEHFGGNLKTFDHPWHGKQSKVTHDGQGIFEGLPNPIHVGRYHSLYVDEASVPECLEVSARTEDGVIMGLRHRELPIRSVQFHPESIMSLRDHAGLRMIHNLLAGI